MKQFNKFGMVVFLLLLAMPMVFAANGTELSTDAFAPVDITNIGGVSEVTNLLARIISIVRLVAVGVAVLASIILGIQFMGARDPIEKKRLGDRLKYILIGLAVVVLSYPIVNLFL
ncbi:hypothetical protein COV20_03680 [Candidatus Woesearchaeota archaeon CG10_big_fil_rev_8_21_14_0_10_45_16]|nr:MAG: hypothetical protein COV20_03680 [Candidatus Woesearchaeota archaeon CG10_big_fil_rev_8_21_14_0_10_45_16]